MFTGLIQAVGKICRQDKRLLIKGCKPFEPLSLGDSVSVDGVCLTVVEISPNSFFADVSEETLMRTTLGEKSQKNDFVNLEPALRLSDRLGGHLVSGHIDGLGEVISIDELQQSWIIKLRWQVVDYGKYICDKGSICLNGISLTISECTNDGTVFSIAVIPHTWINTSLQYLSIGSRVNLEADLMAKYAERILTKAKTPLTDSISNEWLKTHGWI